MRENIIKFLLVTLMIWGYNKNGLTQSDDGIQMHQFVPDIPLGDVYTPESRHLSLDDLKGRLVILDFWNTWCSSCLAAFPKLNELQETYSDSISILLVNSIENRQQIADRFKKLGICESDYPNLTFVASAFELGAAFPHQAVPHHVWIDKKGEVKLIGSSLNTHARKIRDLLNGKSVNFLNNSNTSKPWTINVTLHNLLGVPLAAPSYLFGNHFNSYGALTSISFEGANLDAMPNVRDSYFNNEVTTLYYQVFEKEILQQQRNIIYAGKFSAGTSNYWLDYFNIQYQDTLKLTSGFIPSIYLTDDQFTENRYCYEQILSRSTPLEKRRAYMLHKLNAYFGKRLGLHGRLIEQRVACIVLTSTKSSRGNGKDNSNGITALKKKLQYPIYRLLASEKQPSLFIIDETGLQDSDLENLPHRYNSFEELKKCLKETGVIFSHESRALKFVLLEVESIK